MGDVNFSERSKARVDPHKWVECPATMLVESPWGQFKYDQDFIVWVCEVCKFCTGILPPKFHDLPKCNG